eukprot:COSAG02_NODE_7398_length_3034_cov_2.782698_3_plen_72_part_00
MPRRVAPETAICEGLAMMLRLAPNQVARVGGAGSSGGCGIDQGHGCGGARTELVALAGVGDVIGCDWGEGS